MSILNKLKKINSNTAAQLFERHPLAGESLEVRLQYLAGIALATAIDREPTDTEKQAFTGLANSLSVDESDATEQLNERASVAEDDIAKIFGVISEKDASWIYLLDLSWLHASDGSLDESEVEATAQLADLLEIKSSDVQTLHQFALALNLRKLIDLVEMIPSLPRDPHIQTHLPALLKPCFPYVGVLQNRWIDHGDGTVTDTATGLMWHRCCIGQNWDSNGIAGDAKDFPRNSDPLRAAATVALAEINTNKSFAGYTDWHFPDEEDLCVLLSVTENIPKAENTCTIDIAPIAYPLSTNDTIFRLPSKNRNLDLIGFRTFDGWDNIPRKSLLSVNFQVQNRGNAAVAALVCRDWL